MPYSREEGEYGGYKRGNEWQIILAMSILLPTYHKVISNSSYLSTIAQPDLFEMYDSHRLPVGSPRLWGGHRGVKTARPGEEKYLHFVFMRLCICSYFVFVFAFCNCVFACPP